MDARGESTLAGAITYFGATPSAPSIVAVEPRSVSTRGGDLLTVTTDNAPGDSVPLVGGIPLINIDAPPTAVHELERRLRINEDVMRFKTIRVEELDEEPSPILARRDREERRRARREGGRDGEDGGDFEGGED